MYGFQCLSTLIVSLYTISTTIGNNSAIKLVDDRLRHPFTSCSKYKLCMWSLNLLHIPISRNQNAMDRFIIWRIVFLNQSMAHVISLNWHITFIGVHITEEKETYRVYRCLCFVDSWCNNMSFLKYSTNLNSILIYFTHNSVCLSFDIRILITPFSIFKLVSSSCGTSLLKIELLLQSYFSFCLIYMSMQSTDSLLTFFYY